MNILVTNDDGVQAEGISALVKTLSEHADVFVCAPDGQRSAKSQSITIGEHVIVESIDFEGAKAAYKTSGTPADCVKIGLQFFEEAGNKIDMVYSGINMGSNLGKDTLYSGTVGAAMEAAVSGFPAVAVSVDNHNPKHYECACRLAVQVMELAYNQLTPKTVININTPDLPIGEIKGVKYTVLGDRYYDDKFSLVEDNKYQLTGQPSDFGAHPEDFDVTCAHYKYATITPLHFDYTDYKNMETVKKWGLNI